MAPVGIRAVLAQQNAVAALSGSALAGTELKVLMDESCDALVEILSLDRCAVLGAHGLKDLKVVSSVGLPAEVVAVGPVPGGRFPQASYTLGAIGPVIVEDLRSEKRFETAAMLKRDLVSGVTIAIMVDGVAWGVLAAYVTTSPRSWNDAIPFLQAMANVIGLAIERQRHVEARERDRQRERLAAIGLLAAGVAHDFNNIIAAISLYAELLGTQAGLDDSGHTYVAAVRQQVERGASLVWQVLDFAHRSSLLLVDVDLAAFVDQLIPLLRRTVAHDVRLSVEHDGRPHWVQADLTRLQQIFMNLISNADHAIDGAGQISIALNRHGTDGDGASPLDNPLRRPSVSVDVSDTGSGMPDDVAARAFEPFFTTKSPDRGTGLGLSQVLGLVNQHDGHIELSSRLGEGTKVSVWLPAAVKEGADSQAKPGRIPKGRSELVLVVDDDPAVRGAMAGVLTWLGYTAVLADSGETAYEILASAGNSIAVIVSDVRLPGKGSESLAQVVGRGWPQIPVILVSGYPLDHFEPIGLARVGNARVLTRLQKPFSSRELAAAIGTALHWS